MRWLMRSGDADRIATFAAAARDKNAQLMAADYLRRHADWRTRPDLMRHILHFYTRAKAYGKLAAFYAECAKMEVDEYEVSELRRISAVGLVPDNDSRYSSSTFNHLVIVSTRFQTLNTMKI